MNNNIAHDHNNTPNNRWASRNNPSRKNGNDPETAKYAEDISEDVRVNGSETVDTVTVAAESGPVDVTFISSKVYELERAGDRCTIEVSWREAELTIRNGECAREVPAWLETFGRERLGLDEVALGR